MTRIVPGGVPISSWLPEAVRAKAAEWVSTIWHHKRGWSLDRRLRAFHLAEPSAASLWFKNNNNSIEPQGTQGTQGDCAALSSAPSLAFAAVHCGPCVPCG
jgi:hypothetical protein